MTPDDESHARHASLRPVFSRVTPGSPAPSLAAGQARTAERHTHSVLVRRALPGRLMRAAKTAIGGKAEVRALPARIPLDEGPVRRCTPARSTCRVRTGRVSTTRWN